MYNNPSLVKSDYKMYIYALSGPSSNVLVPPLSQVPIEIYTGHEAKIINEDTNYIAPAITADGNIVFLPVGTKNTLLNLQQKISDIATSQIRSNNVSEISIGNFAVVGTSFHLSNAPNIHCEVYRVLTYKNAIHEFVNIYTFLKTYSENLEDRPRIQSCFTQDLPKKWINDVLLGIKQRLNWDSIVSNAIEEAYQEAGKHESVTNEKVRFVQIDEDGGIVK